MQVFGPEPRKTVGGLCLPISKSAAAVRKSARLASRQKQLEQWDEPLKHKESTKPSKEEELVPLEVEIVEELQFEAPVPELDIKIPAQEWMADDVLPAILPEPESRLHALHRQWQMCGSLGKLQQQVGSQDFAYFVTALKSLALLGDELDGVFTDNGFATIPVLDWHTVHMRQEWLTTVDDEHDPMIL